MSEIIRIDESPEPKEEKQRPIQLDSYPAEYQQIAVKEFDTADSTEQIKSGIDRVLLKSNEKEITLLKGAQVLINNAEYERALKLLSAANRTNPGSRLIIQYIGQCYLGLGETAKAVECFKQNVSTDRDFQSLALLAEAFYASGSDQQALDFYFQALENIDPTSLLLFDIYKNIGNIYVRVKEFDAAEDFYNRAYSIDPHSDTLMVNFGTLEVQKFNWQTAIERFRQAIQINIENDRAWVGLAISHREFGDHELSRGNLFKALDINPMNQVALQLIFDWSNKDGDFEGLLSWVESTIRSRPELVGLRLYYADILCHVQRFEHCQVELQSVLSEYPECSEAEGMLEKVKKMLNQLAGA